MKLGTRPHIGQEGQHIEPTSFVAMKTNTNIVYHTTLSGKSIEIHILGGAHLNSYTFVPSF